MTTAPQAEPYNGLPITEFKPEVTFRTRLLRRLIRATARPMASLPVEFPGVPWPLGLADQLAVALRPVRGVSRQQIELPHCRAEWMTITGHSPQHAILYLHGGGFMLGGLNTHRRLISRIVRDDLDVGSLAVDYRKLPAAPVSAAIADCLTGYQHLIEQGYAPSNIAIVGDSAGGFLALTTALIAHQRRLGTPGAVVALSPLVDRNPHNKMDLPSREVWFPPSVLGRINQLIVETEPDEDSLQLVDSFVDASAATLAGLPPTLIHVASDELLRPDGELAAARLAQAGVPVTLQIWEGQFHVFHLAADITPEARAAVGEAVSFLRKQWNAAHVG